MKNYKFTINGNQYDVEILEVEGNIAKIEVNGTSYEVEIHRELPKAKVTTPPPIQPGTVREAQPVRPVAIPKAAPKSTVIRSPLPGVIIQVLVRPGDEIKADQTVCTLETMKMENAIKAEEGGTIKRVNITPGQSVNQDEVLIEIG